MGDCGCGFLGVSRAEPIAGAEVGVRIGAGATQFVEEIVWLAANFEHGMFRTRSSFALFFDGKVSFSRFLFPPTRY